MKIHAIRTYVVPASWKEWVFVLLETDDGLVGVGEGTLENRTAAVAGAIDECAEYLLGRSPIGIEAIWNELYRAFFWRGGSVQMTALAAIDQALWDIAGKAANLPVHRLLGGAGQDKVRTYLNQWYRGAKSADKLADMAREALDKGASALKWYPFRQIPMNSPPYTVTPQDIRQAVREVELLRDALGPDVTLMVDLAGKLTCAGAIEFCQAATPYDLLFIEEPLPPEDPSSLHRLANATSARIATGERLYSRWDFREIIEQRSVSYVQPALTHAGGITEFRKIAAYADTHGIGLIPHNPLSPVATAANIQTVCTLNNFVLLETYAAGVPPLRDEIMVDGPRLTGDFYQLPDRPGLGVELDEPLLRRICTSTLGHRSTRAAMA